MAPQSYYHAPPVGNLKVLLTVIQSQMTKARLPPKDLSLEGQTVLLTGGNVGVGYGCAEWLVELNVGRLILAVRTPSKGEAAATKLRQKNSRVKIDVWKVDMESYRSVQDLAAQCQSLDRLDIAILNAGALADKFHRGPEGHELSTQVNYYSTVLLSFLLLPILKSKSPTGKPGRLTIVNSGSSFAAKLLHRHEKPFLPTFDDESKFDPLEWYQANKALAQFWILKLAEKVRQEDVVVNLVDPGYVAGTQLHRDVTGFAAFVFAASKAMTGRNIRNGSSTYIDAAVVKGPDSHGSFVMDWKIYPYIAAVHEKGGEEVADKIWEETLQELSFADVQGILDRL
ncbi:putative secondary metabolism biosynthetic enzyme [Amphichorda felina]